MIDAVIDIFSRFIFFNDIIRKITVINGIIDKWYLKADGIATGNKEIIKGNKTARRINIIYL